MKHANQSQNGFSLIELAIVIVILGILAAIAVPRYIESQNRTTRAAKDASLGVVQSTFALYVAERSSYPTIQTIADKVQLYSGEVKAVDSGIQVTIDGTNYLVKTFTDKTCSSATSKTNDTVKCVKGITAEG